MKRMLAPLLLVSVSFLSGPLTSSAITINTVPVGDVDNANDPETGSLYGGVAYNYRIGTSEATVGQYTAFLNAVAATDTYELYNPAMTTDQSVAGIARSGLPGSYTYSVIGSANHPITYVSWGDAARFANWMNNGQPTGPQNSSTTEDGAYTLNGATSSQALGTVTRNAGATWFLPSESEWYKAAYYQPAAHGGDSDNYWRYPMRTNSTPFSDQPPGATPDNTRVGNFYNEFPAGDGFDGYAVTGSLFFDDMQNYLTDVGAYTSSPSYYGTFDQGGNVFEWNEGLLSPLERGLRGGSWETIAGYMDSSSRTYGDGFPSASETALFGFRVAEVPEPSTAMLAALGFGGFIAIRRKRRVE